MAAIAKYLVFFFVLSIFLYGTSCKSISEDSTLTMEATLAPSGAPFPLDQNMIYDGLIVKRDAPLSLRDRFTALEYMIADSVHYYVYSSKTLAYVFPHRYWAPSIFLGICLLVHYFNLYSKNNEEAFLLGYDVDNFDPDLFKASMKRYKKNNEAPSIGAMILRFMAPLILTFTGVFFQHLLISLSYVYMNRQMPVSQKFNQMMSNNGMGIELTFSFFAAEVLSNLYYHHGHKTISDIKGGNYMLFIFTFTFIIVRRFIRNLAFVGSSVILFTFVMFVSAMYAIKGTNISIPVVSPVCAVASTAFSTITVFVIKFLSDNGRSLISAILAIGICTNLFVFSSLTEAVQIIRNIRRTGIVDVVRNNYLFRSVRYGVLWFWWYHRFDWFFGAGLALAYMNAESFPSVLTICSLPVASTFTESLWFTWFYGAGASAFNTPHPTF